MILVINAGSSSIKFQLYQSNKDKKFRVLAKGLAERIDTSSVGTISITYGNNKFSQEITLANHEVAANIILETLKAKKIINDFKEIKGVGHRIVHGGDKIKSSVIVNDEVMSVITDCIKLAPLHNPAGLSAIKAFQKVTNCAHIAVFDTTFHTTMPKLNYIYPVPYDWYENHQVRRYGFHGISYQYIINKLSLIMDKPKTAINAIVCHLGNGASICAIKNGVSYNTSMGLTPLAGVMMGSRSGDIDPSIHQYIAEQLDFSIQEVTNILNKQSGLLGVSQVSSDIRDVTTASQEGNEQAQFTLELYVKRVADYIVQYQNDLGNEVDALVFTAGIGENGKEIRQMILDCVKTMNVSYSQEKNAESYDDYLVISDQTSDVAVLAIRTNEELMICEDTYNLIQ